ncbi:MAG: hypothetical protein BMS9Abin34_477 [Patescibacteria group bacterium]|nr:MAG: hypothetical protein BMS9Abin34_477 [Patescibacteria group bacterium]
MNPVKETTAFYDTVARDYARRWLNSDVMGEQVEYFLNHLKGRHILDAGCGSGRDALVFANRGYRVAGIDLSRNLLALARSAAPEVTFVRMDMRFLGFAAQSFEGLWACASFLHVPEDQALATLRGFRCTLSPNGVLYLSVKEGDGPVWKVDSNGRTFQVRYREEVLRRMVEEAGFEVIRLVRSTGHAVFLDIFARRSS